MSAITVRVATAANGTLATAFANGQAVDGVTLKTGDLILVKDQSTPSENGIYQVNASGAPTRAPSADTGAELSSVIIFIDEGAANAGTVWILETAGTVTVGPSSLNFARLSEPSSGLDPSENLADLDDAAEARDNLGLGSSATLDIDTDGTLAANSDTAIATQKAVRTYVSNAVTGLLDFKNGTDCSGNPNYPAASKGDAYVVSVAGKVGGGSGINVDVGDVFVASADNAGGTHASVGSSWFVLEHNLQGALLQADLANTSDVNGGSSTIKVITPDALAASVFGQVEIEIEVFPPATDVATGDGKKLFTIPAKCNGMNLVGVHDAVGTAGTTGTTDVQIRNATDGVDMLSTKLTIDSGETGSDTAATSAVIDTAHDDVATNDRLFIDLDAVSTTPPKGLVVRLTFQLP